MESLTTTNVWLGILAIVSLLQFLMLVAAGVLGYRMYKHAMETIENLERAHIAPLRVRVDGLLDAVQSVADTVKHAQEFVSRTVRSKTWPFLGLIQGLRTATLVLKNRKRTTM